MIVRVLTANVQPEKSGRLHDLMREQLPILRRHDGLVYVKLARRIQGAIEQVVLIEEWRDAHSMLAWTGLDVTIPRLLPGSAELIDELVITHYEALDVEVDAEASQLVEGA